MPKNLIEASYTAEGTRGLLSEGGTARRAAIDEAVQKLGATLECFYYAFGDHDLVAIVDAPNTVGVAAMNLQVAAAGGAKTRTTALLTSEEIDRAAAIAAGYRAPGER